MRSLIEGGGCFPLLDFDDLRGGVCIELKLATCNKDEIATEGGNCKKVEIARKESKGHR